MWTPPRFAAEFRTLSRCPFFRSGLWSPHLIGTWQAPSEAEAAALRAAAAEELVNISDEERERRRVAGIVLSVLTASLAAALLNAHVPPTTRFAIAPPVFLSLGYLASAREGL